MIDSIKDFDTIEISRSQNLPLALFYSTWNL